MAGDPESPGRGADPVTAVIGIGANLGDPVATVLSAIEALRALADPARPLQVSSLYRTAPVDAAGPDFVNAVACLDTRLAPGDLLHALQAIEARFGRERPYRNAPRTLDLDLILHGATISTDPALTLPHPRAHERGFVLAPLAELWPGAVLPGRGRVADLLASVERRESQPVQRLPGPYNPT
jgi:2-amino-4-hydroxy-6-hydroxymethyldihydropteridine diphosphokinase